MKHFCASSVSGSGASPGTQAPSQYSGKQRLLLQEVIGRTAVGAGDDSGLINPEVVTISAVPMARQGYGRTGDSLQHD